MKSIFDSEVKEELKNRIQNLKPDSERKWGKMDAAQMLWHCQYPLKLAIKNEYKGNGKMLMKLFKRSLYSEKPFKKGLPTAKFLIATEPKNFIKEQTEILDLIDQTHELKTRTEWSPHPLFGKFTHEQWGVLEFKHLDHHLKQFVDADNP